MEKDSFHVTQAKSYIGRVILLERNVEEGNKKPLFVAGLC